MKGGGRGSDSFRGQDCHLRCGKASPSRGRSLLKSRSGASWADFKRERGLEGAGVFQSGWLQATAQGGFSSDKSNSHAPGTSKWPSERSGAEGSHEAGSPAASAPGWRGTLPPLPPHPIPQLLRNGRLIPGVMRAHSNLARAEEWVTSPLEDEGPSRRNGLVMTYLADPKCWHRASQLCFREPGKYTPHARLLTAGVTPSPPEPGKPWTASSAREPGSRVDEKDKYGHTL